MKPWLPKTVLRAARLSLLWAALSWCVGAGQAQTAIPANAQLVAPSAIPKFGNFYTLHRAGGGPPLPGLPPAYAEAGLPVYWLGGSRYLVDDTSLDWAAIEAQRRQAQAVAAGAQRNGPTPFEPDGDDGPPILTDSEESTNSLRLTSPVFSGAAMSLNILGAAPDGVYDLYWHSLLGDATPYAHIARAQPGQTNFLLNAGTSPTGFLLLGTQLDSDGDGIPDAYENLVTKTDPHIANTAESLGTNAWLVQDVTPVVGNSEAFEIINRWTDRNPCQGQGTNQGQQAPALDNFFQTSRWHHAYGGTQTTVWVGLTCSNGTVVTNVNTTVVNWDGSGSEPAKFAWSLSGVDGASNTTSLYWSHNVKRAVVTGGLPLSTMQRPWIVHGSATELVPTWDRPLQTSNAIPTTSISIAGKQLDTNGEAVVVFRDNSTNDITATVTGFTNYAYSTAADRVNTTLLFNIDQLTAPESTNALGQVYGCETLTYDSWTNFLDGVSLGTSLRTKDGGYANAVEIDAYVPLQATFDSGWKWHQDTARTTYTWREGNASVLTNSTDHGFSPGTPGQIEGNDSLQLDDTSPDAARLVLMLDAPYVRPTNPADLDPQQPAIVFAYRFYARTWATWNGVQASDVLKWRSFVTLRRKQGGGLEWGSPTVIERLAQGEPEIPSFTVQEAQAILAQP